MLVEVVLAVGAAGENRLIARVVTLAAELGIYYMPGYEDLAREQGLCDRESGWNIRIRIGPAHFVLHVFVRVNLHLRSHAPTVLISRERVPDLSGELGTGGFASRTAYASHEQFLRDPANCQRILREKHLGIRFGRFLALRVESLHDQLLSRGYPSTEVSSC